METPRISAIVAVGKNREIGKEKKLLWKLDADYERMKRLIKGHPLVMGRATYESIGRELPHSPSIVITRDTTYISPYKNPQHTIIVHSVEEALSKAKELERSNESEDKEVFIFGGSQVYTETLPQTQRLYVTEVDAADTDADSFFPEYTEFQKILESTEFVENDIRFKLLTLER